MHLVIERRERLEEVKIEAEIDRAGFEPNLIIS